LILSAEDSRPKEDPGRPTILVVEDDIVVRTAVAEYLRSAGNLVVEAGDAAAAVAAFAAGMAIDAVFSDVQMPGPMDGLDLARWLRKHHPAVRVGLTSGAANGARAAKVADIFVPKPYQAAEVADRVRRMLSGAQSPAARRSMLRRPRRAAEEPEPGRRPVPSDNQDDPGRR
jgi:CheY-like chemotaxis protein